MSDDATLVASLDVAAPVNHDYTLYKSYHIISEVIGYYVRPFVCCTLTPQIMSRYPYPRSVRITLTVGLPYRIVP